MSSSDASHGSPLSTHPQQTSPTPQQSPTASTSRILSPAPSLAPIPNPIPSPGATSLQSALNQNVMVHGPQHSPANMPSNYSGHAQPSPSPHHYSPTHNMANHQTFSPYAPSSQATSRNQGSLSYPQVPPDSNVYSNSCSQEINSSYPNQLSSLATSPHSQCLIPENSTSNNMPFSQNQGKGIDPLMSLQKLVMLPETQVIDPKSVVNDACLSSQSNENDEVPKNVDGPAEGCAESSGSSVGCSGQLSSLVSSQSASDEATHEMSSVKEKPKLGYQNPTKTSFLASDKSVNCEETGKEFAKSPKESEGVLPKNETVQTVSKNQGKKDLNSEQSVHAPMQDSLKLLNIDNQNQTDVECLKGCENKVMKDSPEDTQIVNRLEEKIVGSSAETNVAVGKDLVDMNDQGKESSIDEVLLENSCVAQDVLLNSEIEIDKKACKSGTTDEKFEYGDFKREDIFNESPIHATSEIKTNIDKILSNVKTDPSLIEEQQCDGILHSLKHEYGKVNPLSEDVKTSYQCRPGILSEVPLIVNGLSTADSIDDVSAIHDSNSHFTALVDIKAQNGFSAKLRSRLRVGDKTRQFLRLTTPCSIAVGADERALCERFVFRRNEYCHTLRTSRLLCNGRTRQDSTGNGDSDESIENVSDTSFHTQGNPQDGNKKKPSNSSMKRNDSKTPKVQDSRVASKKGNSSSTTGSHFQNGHNLSNSNGQNAGGSDDDNDGDVCYYEGVDSSDFFMSMASSDESGSSSQEMKQSPNNSPASSNKKDLPFSSVKTKNSQEKDKLDNLDENSSGPPSKRTRRSSGPNFNDPINSKSSFGIKSNKKSNSANSESAKLVPKNQNSPQEDGHKNGKIARSLSRRRKHPLASKEKLSRVATQCQQRSFIDSTSTKPDSSISISSVVEVNDIVPIVIDDSSPEKCEEPLVEPIRELNYNITNTSFSHKLEKSTSDDSAFKQVHVKETTSAAGEKSIDLEKCQQQTLKAPIRRTPNRKNRNKSKKGKKRSLMKDNRNRSDEVKDSFKSMKFGRTLDLMKNQKKKDSCYTGPFLRVVGSKNVPNSVSIFNQSSVDSLPVTTKHKQHQKQSISRSVGTAVHMVSSLSSDKTAMVSSTKCIPNQQWSCAFCSQHSSYQCMGDLFGPYYKESDLPTVETLMLMESKKGESRASMSKQSKTSPVDKKGQRKRKPSDRVVPDYPLEIWLHESCALWAPGVFLIGNKVYGLDDAVRDTADCVSFLCFFPVTFV